MGCNQVLPGHTLFFLFLFFSQLGLVPAPDPGLTHQTGSSFKTMIMSLIFDNILKYFLYFKIYFWYYNIKDKFKT
jgi:hypothetical protein